MDGQAKPFALTLKVGSDRMSAESCHEANNGKQLSGLQGGPQTHEFGQFGQLQVNNDISHNVPITQENIHYYYYYYYY